MMRYLSIFSASLLSLSAHAFDWQDLWFTPDQQGQRLMAKNQYKEAKETFTRSDWAAAAAYRAGDYKKAAELYRDLKNEEGYYNQGNTLAHLGKYEEALKAYDKALAMNPANQDALHNRKIVEELLKNDKNKEQNKDQKDQQDKDQQDKDQQDKDKQDKDKQDKDKQDKDKQDKDKQDKDKQDKDKQDKDKQDKDKQDKDKQDKDKQDKDKLDKEQNNSEEEREKQQAKEQWLRLIPDDPGGLMREKFLRDHLRRQRGWYQ